MSNSNGESPDVLPPWAARTLAALWILLFAVRWMVTPVIPAAQLAVWDARLLSPCYLLLFVVTVVVLALRAVRGARPSVSLSSEGGRPSEAQPSARKRAVSSQTAAGSGEPHD